MDDCRAHGLGLAVGAHWSVLDKMAVLPLSMKSGQAAADVMHQWHFSGQARPHDCCLERQLR